MYDNQASTSRSIVLSLARKFVPYENAAVEHRHSASKATRSALVDGLLVIPEFFVVTRIYEMCNDCENKKKGKESQMNAIEYGNFSQKASNSNNATVKTPNQKDKNTMNLNKPQKPTNSNNSDEEKFVLPSVSQINLNDDREETTSSSRTSSTASVITKLPTEAGKKNLNK
uniref:Uncharacterized protein n=1 Tax=Lygus hesperus TaxID=30085 RepID=A0A0A9Z9F7_LYGHE